MRPARSMGWDLFFFTGTVKVEKTLAKRLTLTKNESKLNPHQLQK
jgi:hypothetical protein